MPVTPVPFYAAGLLSVPSGWKRVKGPGTRVGYEKQYSFAPDEHGDGQAHYVHSPQMPFSEDFVCNNNTNTIPADLGIVQNTNYVLLGISIQTSVEYARMTLKGIWYADPPTTPIWKYTHGITVSACKGALDFMGGTLGDEAHLISSTIDIECQPNIGFDGQGVGFQIEVSDGTIQATSTYLGKPTTEAGTGWVASGYAPEQSRYNQWVVTGHKLLAGVTVA